MTNIILDNFDSVDLSLYFFPHFTIFENPADFPGEFVVRLFDMNGRTPYMVRADSLSKVREAIPVGLVQSIRDPEDYPHIVETWF
jgi:hypothetical protein